MLLLPLIWFLTIDYIYPILKSQNQGSLILVVFCPLATSDWSLRVDIFSYSAFSVHCLV